jgi:hypothetical protein
MAHLAEQLGRLFEARALLTVAISENPDRADLQHDLVRVSQNSQRLIQRGQTLAKVLSQEQD